MAKAYDKTWFKTFHFSSHFMLCDSETSSAQTFQELNNSEVITA